MSKRVLVSIVTYNSGKYLRSCLRSLQKQTYPALTVRLWDNASSDECVEIISQYADFLDVAHFSNKNIGFCAAHNRLIDSTDADYVLVLNPDVVLERRHLEILVAALDGDETAGSATGKLWRWNLDEGRGKTGADPEFNETTPDPAARILDTTGIYFTPNQRHLDRGSGQLDKGQYERREYVFGASGAAALYRRSMLEDVRAGTEYFDEAFFAYREDADLAWRAQWLGWRCLYVPEAQGFHVRQVLPERRKLVSREVNMHSFKNRFLMRVKNMDVRTYARFFLPITVRDLAAIAYVLLRERSSLAGIPLFLRALPRTWELRAALRNHRRTSSREMRRWFSSSPAARPVSSGFIGTRTGPATDRAG